MTASAMVRVSWVLAVAFFVVTGLWPLVSPDTFFDALNYDLGTHAAITFDTLFNPGTQPLDVLNPIVLRELQIAAGGGL